MSPENYYEILGVGEGAGDDEIKQAFRELAKHHHPDRNPGDADAERQFRRINTAYEGLKDESRRQAYSEWLAFAEKREKVRRTQWGRLIALVCLLFLGPSAVLYWAVVIADIPLFSGSGDRPPIVTERRETSLPPPRPERRPPVDPGANSVAASAPAANSVAETQPVPETAPPPQPEAPQPPEQTAAGPATSPQQSETPTAASPQENAPPPAPPAAEAQPPAGTETAARADQPAEEPAAPAPAVPAREDVFSSDESTQALSNDPPPADPVDEPEQADSPGDGAETETAAAEPPSAPLPPLPELRGDRVGEDAPDTARGTARMLARLKEPGGALPDAVSPPEDRPSAPQAGGITAKEGLPPGTFTDCDECPILSVAGSNEALGGRVRAAVSLTEITLADWDGCVADGACPAYTRPLRGSRRETVVDVNPQEAEAYARWLSDISGQPYRHVMTAPKRQASAQRCNGLGRGRNNSGWEWLEESANRDCPPAAESAADAARSFRVFRRTRPGG